MSEQELKLHVPAVARRAVQQDIRQGNASRIRLRALYFDTPGRELARARIALRLRQEGRDWVQTLKMPGADAITRVEINHARPGPVLDLSVYAGTEVEAPLSAIKGELGLCYETDVQRLLRQVRSRHGTIELAYDTGVLRAGTLELPISELEFELMSGRPAAIFAVARRWQQRHGLVLDARSKSERGDALASLARELAALDADDPDAQVRRGTAITRFWAPRGAAAVTLDDTLTPAQAMGRVAAECLDQVARNAAVLAEVDTLGVYPAGQSEHVHQLRVGMRRLRSAWRLFDGWTAPPPATVLQGVRTHFAAFGQSRDQDVLNETVTPVLLQAGMPVITFEAPPVDIDAQAIAAGKAFQGWLLDALEWSLDVQPPSPASAPEPMAASDTAPEPAFRLDGSATAPAITPTIIPLATEAKPQPLHKLLGNRLHRWHAKVAAQGKDFATLDIPARHDLRKRGKRLRYGLSFAESLLPKSRLRGYRKLLSEVQDRLGEINDLAMAKDYYQACVGTHPQAWFALGWISARLDKLIAEAQQAFDRLADTKPFWK
ncbi:CYTH and CHAD domain-containing protein [Bordetella sp. BOR01]|uniref:CYTH and CHAD domain-containing protein n=1 Tax=Bordetella sp. BOR01 TaxID=2854779 RepID=UPI001C4503BE|nr:CYTH and CHAD domain-containing protein [Bordetella sp. BOR01]MBV7483710.1 CYTH and CHAD domain-containing protein [Bordetella sp. BOR01]